MPASACKEKLPRKELGQDLFEQEFSHAPAELGRMENLLQAGDILAYFADPLAGLAELSELLADFTDRLERLAQPFAHLVAARLRRPDILRQARRQAILQAAHLLVHVRGQTPECFLELAAQGVDLLLQKMERGIGRAGRAKLGRLPQHERK